MAMYQLPTGFYRTNAGLAFRGGSFSESRDFVAAAILVRHPRGDLLFDAGFGADVAAHVLSLPSFQRAPYELGQTVRAQLDAANYNLGALRGIVITHSHWDHVSGIADWPVPIWMNASERRYAEAAEDDHVFRTVSRGHEIREYDFDGPPYLGFPSSHDVWSDGSVVLVPAPGHTNGSLIAFIALPDGQRYALIGDLTWQLDGIERRAERPWLLRTLADVDAARLREDLLRVIALSGQIHLVPSHDARAYAGIPRGP
jgi:glyoxylase-like metal-dependent hydrolase (beta-lactamase superfamily II)